MTIYIVASGAYCESVTGELPPLKNLLRESIGRPVRRIGRFIQLALIGAGQASAGMPEQAAVYLASSRGDMAATVEVLETMYRHRQVPRPISFINTVSNAACFYVAQCLALKGPSSFVTSHFFPMETALKVALLELETQRINAALVGVVDVVVAPLVDHRQRLRLAASTTLAEASHWLQLLANPGDRPVLATLDWIKHFPDRQALSQFLNQENFFPDCLLAVGQYMDQSEAEEWRSSTGLLPFIEGGNPGYFESQLGQTLCRYITEGEGQLLFLNRDPHGRYMAVFCSK